MNNSLHTSQYYISHITDHALRITQKNKDAARVDKALKRQKWVKGDGRRV